MTTKNRLVTTWKDSWHPGKTGNGGYRGPAIRCIVFVRGQPTILATSNLQKSRRNMTENTETNRNVPSTPTGTGVECKCGKVCKNLRGLRVHQSRTACGRAMPQKQRSGSSPGETQKNTSQEDHHSTGNLLEDVALHDDEQMLELESRNQDDSLFADFEDETLESNAERVVKTQRERGISNMSRVKWPKTSDKAEWKQLDDDLDKLLEQTLKGPVETKLESLTSIVYTVSKDRFGLCEKKEPKPQEPNRREKEMRRIRKELRDLKKCFKNASMEEKDGLKVLRDGLREHLKSLRKAERLKINRKLKSRRRFQFTANPYKFSKMLFESERGGKLESTVEEVEAFLDQSHSDPLKDEPLEECSRIEPVPVPMNQFDCKEPTFHEVECVVRKVRSCSAP